MATAKQLKAGQDRAGTVRAPAAVPTPPTMGKTAGRRVKPSNAERFLGEGRRRVPRAPGRDPGVLTTLRLLRDFDADANVAAWTILRLGNNGHTVEVVDDGDTPLQGEAQDRLNELAERIWEGRGGDKLVGAMLLALYTYGGVGLELVLTDDLLEIDDIYPFGPTDIDFVYTVPEGSTGGTGQDERPRLGLVPARGNAQEKRTPLNPLQVRYEPLDPDINDPYGRSPMLPAVRTLLKLVQMVDTHLEVSEVQGYGQGDVTVDAQKIAATYPELNNPGREDELKNYLNQALTDATQQVEGRDPMDWLVHLDSMSFNYTTPSGRGASMGIEPMLGFFGQREASALKMMPIMLGATENVGAQTTVQWQVQVHGIRTLQGEVKRIFEWAYNTSLRVWGLQGKVRVTFNTIRDTDRMIEAQADSLEYNNERSKLVDGVIDHATFADRTDGHEPMGAPPPTSREIFEQQNQAAAAAAATTTTADGTDANLPDANQPGTDAGISAEEGDALDEAGQNAALGSRNMLTLIQEVRRCQTELYTRHERKALSTDAYNRGFQLVMHAYYLARANGSFDLQEELARLGGLPAITPAPVIEPDAEDDEEEVEGVTVQTDA